MANQSKGPTETMSQQSKVQISMTERSKGNNGKYDQKQTRETKEGKGNCGTKPTKAKKKKELNEGVS